MTEPFDARSTADDVLSGVDLKGKRFLVTGASSGIGLETARALAARGADIVGTVRDIAAAASVVQPIRDAARDARGSVELIDLDLASLSSIRTSAGALLANGRRIDVIVANAGIMAPPFGLTVDGFELQFGTNHLGHFAFVNAIEPLLNEGGRLVVLSSQAHRASDVDLDDPNFARKPYDPFLAYARSKTANALFAVGFDRRHRDRRIRAMSVMPGNSITNLPRQFSKEDLQGLLKMSEDARANAGVAPKQMKNVGQAAATSVWAAAVADEDAIGGHYLEDCAVAPVEDTPNAFLDGVMPYALDADRAERLWTRTEDLIKAA